MQDRVDYARVFEATPSLYLVLSPDLHIQAASNAYLQATMTQRADLVGRHLFEAFPDNPDDPAATGVRNLSVSLQRVLATGKPDVMAVQKYDIRRPDAPDGAFEERFWSPVNVPVFDVQGRLQHILHRVEDVTEYVRLEASASGGTAAAAAGTVNRTRGMEAEIMRRAQELQLVNRELRALHEQLEQRVAERTEALEREVDARRRTAAALERLEAQLRQAQRLEAVGHLAGGIAHDFNNLLTVILGFEAIARLRLPEGSPVLEDLDQIRHAGGRAAELTSQLLTFSRKQMREVTSLDVNQLLNGMRTMLARLLGAGIELRVRCRAAGRVDADPGQIEQVVMNLVVNARDAMPDGGLLTIETCDVELDAAYAAEHLDVEPGAYTMLAVSDTGTGMDAETQSHVFEPFFTTKGVGKGTGLGLSTVFGIVKQGRGHVWVYSEPGVGSTFKVYLPHGRAPLAPTSPSQPVPGRTDVVETLLLVEDDERVRLVAARILQGAGYRTIEADGPDAALAIARDPSAVFDALVTDVVMPRMGGRQLAELVQSIRPGVGVLFMSGYTDDVVLQGGAQTPSLSFVQKPLMPAALTRKVREVLDRAAAERRAVT